MRMWIRRVPRLLSVLAERAKSKWSILGLVLIFIVAIPESGLFAAGNGGTRTFLLSISHFAFLLLAN